MTTARRLLSAKAGLGHVPATCRRCSLADFRRIQRNRRYHGSSKGQSQSQSVETVLLCVAHWLSRPPCGAAVCPPDGKGSAFPEMNIFMGECPISVHCPSSFQPGCRLEIIVESPSPDQFGNVCSLQLAWPRRRTVSCGPAPRCLKSGRATSRSRPRRRTSKSRNESRQSRS